ncbi:MAG: hypothetical protein ACSLFM_08185 [Tepidiformaceae bacterium]
MNFPRARTLRRLTLGLAVTGSLAILGMACSDDEASPEEIKEVEDTVATLFASGPDEADYVFAHTTDNMFKTVFFTTREDCEADTEACLGEPSELTSVTETEIEGDEATTRAEVEFGVFEVALVRDDDVWKVDTMRAISDDIADDTEEVDLKLVDFGFEFDADDIPEDGNFAFVIENEGDQPHEVVMFAVDAEGDLAEAIENTPEGPPAGFKLFIQSDQKDVGMAFEAPLEPGRYALVCFFPDIEDPEGTPHMAKGMLAEFTIE